MNEAELQTYLYQNIPLSQAMSVCVKSASATSVILSAPIAPNINHHATVFGGSAATLAILSAWSLVHLRLQIEKVDAQLVIQRSTVDYTKPIQGEFWARSHIEEEAWETFLRMFARKGKARVRVEAVLEHAHIQVGSFSGEFVALKP